MSSKCKTCGEQIAATGNYSFKIIPAKKIPRKAMKLVGNPFSHQSSWGTTSFQRFLMKRSAPANIMEISCGKCGDVSKLKMMKPIRCHPRTEGTPAEIDQSSCGNPSGFTQSDASAKKKKKARDKFAGLTLSAAAPVSESDTPLFQAIPSNQPLPTLSSGVSRKRSISSFQKKKEMDNLKKALFHSKKAKKSGSSLQDFLSGI